MVRVLITLACLAAVVPQRAAEGMEREATQFLKALTPELRKITLLPAGSEAKYDWHYVPKTRLGVAWKQMSSAQREAGKDLLRASLSQAGYEKIEQIRQLEVILKEIENGNPGRDPEDYHFLFFGEPGKDSAWGWRYEGHHLSLSFAVADGKLVSSTPQFLGTNPAKSKAGEPLAKVKDLGLRFLQSLTSEQKGKAVVRSSAPGDIVTTIERQAVLKDRLGISYQSLTEAQRKLLIDVVAAHAEVQSKAEAARRMKAFAMEDPAKLVFAWMGSQDATGGHYYRIQGEDLLIEYQNVQNNANHVHTVWRRLGEDFGGDVLLEHYRHGHRH